jgi:hypothetical protein
VDKFDRIFQLHAILSSRRTAIPLEDLMARLECSKSTLDRAINALLQRLLKDAGGGCSRSIWRHAAEGSARTNLKEFFASCGAVRAPPLVFTRYPMLASAQYDHAGANALRHFVVRAAAQLASGAMLLHSAPLLEEERYSVRSALPK